jgi:long-chain acyl-CoA synthetase
MMELYLAALQAGFYLVPINHHLTASETAYILQDSGAKAFVGSDRFSETCTGAASEAKFPERARFALGRIPGFRPGTSCRPGSPTGCRRIAPRAGDELHVGHDGPSEGRAPLAPPIDPDEFASLFAMLLFLFNVQPKDGNVHLVGSPLYHTAVLMFAGCSLHMGHGVVLMDKWLPSGTCS